MTELTVAIDDLNLEHLKQESIPDENSDNSCPSADKEEIVCDDDESKAPISIVTPVLVATSKECKLDEKLPMTSNATITGLIYDERMTGYWCPNVSNHVERPARVASIYKKLVTEGLVERCKLLTPRFATKEEILLKHSEKHYEVILSAKDMNSDELNDLSSEYDSIYFHPQVTEASLLSAGCTLELVEQVIQGGILNGAAVVRPPGHHALSHCSMGFCHFNNVAIAAMLAIQKHKLERILIVDWDIHYGNGVHKMFQSDPRVLYFSMHRYDNNNFWPCLSEGNYDAVGLDEGEGFNIHVAWNRRGMGDSEYLSAFENVLLPVAKQYNPELILVSSGFDSGLGDPLGSCKVTPYGYACMTKHLMNISNGKVAIVLEGGYNLSTISKSMAACVRTLLGEVPSHLDLKKPCDSAINSISNTLHAIQKYWSSLKTINELFVHPPPVEEKYIMSSSSSEEELSDLIE